MASENQRIMNDYLQKFRALRLEDKKATLENMRSKPDSPPVFRKLINECTLIYNEEAKKHNASVTKSATKPKPTSEVAIPKSKTMPTKTTDDFLADAKTIVKEVEKKALSSGMDEKKRKPIIAIIGFLLVAFVGLKLFGGGGIGLDQSTPENACMSFVKAIKQQNYTTASQIYPVENDGNLPMSKAYNALQDYDINNLKVLYKNAYQSILTGQNQPAQCQLFTKDGSTALPILRFTIAREGNKYYITSIRR